MTLTKQPNNNPGIEQEYAYFIKLTKEKELLGYSLTWQEKESINEVLNHPKITLIHQIENDTNDVALDEETINLLKNGAEVVLSTQDDSCGPADVVLYEPGSKKAKYGTSVKNGNKCQSNISGQTAMIMFGSTFPWDEMKYDIYEKYLEEAKTKKGEDPKNWFRTRFKSHVVEETIDCIRDIFIDGFNKPENKDKSLSFLKHALNSYDDNETTPYNICRYQKKSGKWTMKYGAAPTYDKTMLSNVVAKKWKGSYVGFFRGEEDKPIYKMQVKFNNGILERANEGTKGAIQLDNNLYAKIGNPLTSWNFFLC